MQPTHTQPHAVPISDELVSAILADTLSEHAEASGFTVNRHHEFANDMAVVTLADGRRMMVKRGRHPWSAERFSVARRAARLLRTAAGIVVPEPLDLRPDLAPEPLEAYWRIELPLFAEVWKELGPPQRRASMRSLGRLIRRVHASAEALDLQRRALEPEPFSVEAVECDLVGRLLPAIAGEWREALEPLQLLIDAAPAALRTAAATPVVLHGDLHLGNVLCHRAERQARCVGLIDLEWVHSGPPESDFARFQVMHTGPFDMPVEGHALEWAHEGYDRPLDRRLLSIYSLYHLLNLGLYSAVIGDGWHADAVLAEAVSVARRL